MALWARTSLRRIVLKSHRNQKTCNQNQTQGLFTKVREMESPGGLPQITVNKICGPEHSAAIVLIVIRAALKRLTTIKFQSLS